MTVVLFAWLGVAVFWDWKARRIPNWLVLGGVALAGLSLALNVHPLGLDVEQALTAATAGFLALLAFYALGLMGAADVKFAAALGLWIGPWPLLWVWIGASLLAALHALILIGWRRHTGLPRTRKREIPSAAHMAEMTMGWLIWRHQMS